MKWKVRKIPLALKKLIAAICLAVGLPGTLLGQAQPQDQLPTVDPTPPTVNRLLGAPDPRTQVEEYASFVRGRVDLFWAWQFQGTGVPYASPGLVIVRQDGQSACGAYSGNGEAFYCPADQTTYISADFGSRMTGNFGMAYVLAHEWAHHVQTLFGLEAFYYQERKKAEAAADQRVGQGLAINYELQADCFAGVWSRSVYGQGQITDEHIVEAQNLAVTIGDDALGIKLEKWAHGSSAQRLEWFNYGFQTGDASRCLLYSADDHRTALEQLVTQAEQPPAQTEGLRSGMTLSLGNYQLTLPQGTTGQQLVTGVIELQTSGQGFTLIAHIGPQTNLAPVPSHSQLASVMQAWNPDYPLQPLGQVQPLAGYTHLDGWTLTQWYEQPLVDMRGPNMVHGLFMLHVGQDGQGVVVDIFSSGSAQDAQDWQVLGEYAGTLLNHLREGY